MKLHINNKTIYFTPEDVQKFKALKESFTEFKTKINDLNFEDVLFMAYSAGFSDAWGKRKDEVTKSYNAGLEAAAKLHGSMRNKGEICDFKRMDEAGTYNFEIACYKSKKRV
jgi:hypothetical protein